MERSDDRSQATEHESGDMTAARQKPALSTPHLVFRSSELKGTLKPWCNKVLKEFQQLPPLRLLCYFDDQNPESLHRQFGEFTSVHTPVIGSGTWPDNVKRLFFASDGTFAYDNLIYVPGTRYSQEKVPFVMTFAHELQHFVQWGFARKVYKANALLFQNLLSFEPTTNAKPWDIPYNREAMIVSKRVAEAVCEADKVREFIDAQILDSERSNNISKNELWRCFRSLPSSRTYDLRHETDVLVQKYRSQLSELGTKIDFASSKWWA